MTWCTLTVQVDVDLDILDHSGEKVAIALLRNVPGFKAVGNVDLQRHDALTGPGFAGFQR